MQSTLSSIHGNVREDYGKQAAIIVPLPVAKKLEQAIEIETDLVPESTICLKFGVDKKTLANDRSNGKIPKCDYTIGFNKSRWYRLSRMLGLKNFLSTKKNSLRKAI